MKHTTLLASFMLLMVADKALAYRDGWTAENMITMTDSCVSDILEPLRQGFEQKVVQKGNTSKEFPEEKLKPSITDFCACITFRAANAHDYQKVINDPGIVQAYATEAIKGGECKPSGLLGEIMHGK
jgi:hypothetical protein